MRGGLALLLALALAACAAREGGTAGPYVGGGGGVTLRGGS